MRRGRIGSWVLLQPDRINGYAQAVIRTLQADEYQRGDQATIAKASAESWEQDDFSEMFLDDSATHDSAMIGCGPEAELICIPIRARTGTLNL